MISTPSAAQRWATALMVALRPGTSPPPVKIPTRRIFVILRPASVWLDVDVSLENSLLTTLGQAEFGSGQAGLALASNPLYFGDFQPQTNREHQRRVNQSSSINILTRADELVEFCSRVRKHGSLALDTEFERERTYKPILQLVQAATPDEAVIVDPLELRDLTPLWQLVADPKIETILHAASQDLEIYWEQAHELPRNLFDTQVAGALLGMGEQPGYADLLRRVLDVRLKKHERVTDWGRRPLSEGQLRYALDDVAYLHELRDELTRDLEELGRRDWLDEELSYYEDIETFEVDKTRLWMRVSRHRSLRARGLAILRELAAWREDKARTRNIPRGRVIQDAATTPV